MEIIMKNFVPILFLFYIFCSLASAETYLFVGSNFPHLLEETPEGNFQGVGADIAKEIVEGLGHTIEIKMYPWARAQRMLELGQADAIIGPYKTSKRSKFMDYTSHHFYTDRIVFYAKSDNSLIWNGNFSSLQGHVIGATQGWSYGSAFDQIKSTLTIETVQELCSNFKKLMVGRVEIVPATHRNALVCIEELNIRDKVALLLPDIQSTKGYYGFSKHKKLSQFKAQFDERLQKMIKTGAVPRINQTYQLIY